MASEKEETWFGCIVALSASLSRNGNSSSLFSPQAGLHKLELNPFWKDGGTGLPPEQKAVAPARKGSL